MTGLNGADLFGGTDAQPGPAARALAHAREATTECPHCKGTGRVPARTLGERLRALRAETGLLQTQVCERLNGIISAANLGHVECDRNPNPRLDVIRALAEFYNVRPGWLIDGDPDP
jgi:hypothetical protein